MPGWDTHARGFAMYTPVDTGVRVTVRKPSRKGMRTQSAMFGNEIHAQNWARVFVGKKTEV